MTLGQGEVFVIRRAVGLLACAIEARDALS